LRAGLRLCAPFVGCAAVFSAHPAQAVEVARIGGLVVERFTEADGLGTSQLTGLYRDSRGFVWLSSFQGVSRWDGARFAHYGYGHGLRELNTAIVGENGAGEIFVRGIGHVYRYTGNASTPFQAYPANDHYVVAAAPAATASAVWVSYADTAAGLTLLSPDRVLAFIPMRYRVTDLARDRSGTVYALDSTGTVWVVEESRRVRKLIALNPKPPFIGSGAGMQPNAAGEVWLHAANTATVKRLSPRGVVDSLALPAATPWWMWHVGGDRRLYGLLDKKGLAVAAGGRWQPLVSAAQMPGNFSGVDAARNRDEVWVSTTGGLFRITRALHRAAPAVSLAHYFVTSGGRVAIRHDSAMLRKPAVVAAFRQVTAAQTLTGVHSARNGSVYFCTEEDVWQLSPGGPLKRLHLPALTPEPEAYFRFRRVLEDNRGGVWFTSYNGLFYQPPGRPDSIAYFFTHQGLTDGALYALVIDRDGVVYASGASIWVLDGSRFQNLSRALGLPSDIIRLTTDGAGRMWGANGTDHLYCIGRAGRGFAIRDSLVLRYNGLPLNAGSAVFSADGHLWVTDERDLYCFPRSANGLYATAAPLAWREHYAGAPVLYPSADGTEVHALSGTDLYSYPARALRDGYAPQQPRVFFTGLLLHRQAHNWVADGYATNPLGMPAGVRLNHRQNFLTFLFAATTPAYATPTAYRYKLQGYDSGFSPPSPEPQAEYTGLPAGRYTLMVQAQRGGGPWSPPVSYAFSIAPAWYNTWWALVLLVVGMGLKVWWAVRYWVRANARKSKLQGLLAEEQLKALRAQINPHFLQNTFAFLAHSLSAAGSAGTAPDVLKTIDGVSTYMRKVLLMSDKQTVTLEEELEFAEGYLAMQQRLLTTPFQYAIHIDDEVDIFDMRVPSMLLQPVIENALKHGLRSDGTGRVTVTVRAHGDHYVHCTVEDTGGGTPTSSPMHTGKGLALTSERLRLFFRENKHPATLTHAPNESGGRTVTVALPLG